ncbi:MAG: hypothetical protein QNJ63_06325 [Calothrix sp. MO_192.B10]|nr:hypothetical protein [Calothrix sp. MO_192.B10]
MKNKTRVKTINTTEDISFLCSFFDEDCHLFIEQIQADLGYFQHGATLLEKAMTAIQGRVEIEQAQSDRTTQEILRKKEERDQVRDRNLQTTIAMVGVGLGAAGIGASTAPYIISQQPTKPILPPFVTNQLHPSAQAVLLSLGFGITGVIIAGVLSCLIQNRSAITGRIFKLIRPGSNHTVISPGSQQTLLQEEKQHK